MSDKFHGYYMKIFASKILVLTEEDILFRAIQSESLADISEGS
jgi:hypothetical protein